MLASQTKLHVVDADLLCLAQIRKAHSKLIRRLAAAHFLHFELYECVKQIELV